MAAGAAAASSIVVEADDFGDFEYDIPGVGESGVGSGGGEELEKRSDEDNVSQLDLNGLIQEDHDDDDEDQLDSAANQFNPNSREDDDDDDDSRSTSGLAHQEVKLPIIFFIIIAQI